MAKLGNIESVEVDSTATAYIRTSGDQKPEKGALEKAMRRHKVRSLERVVRKAPAATYVVTLKGMS